VAVRLDQLFETFRNSRRATALFAGVLASAALLACLAASAHAADRVYWANDGFSTGSRIAYANLDGSGGAGVLNTTLAPSGSPRGVAIDIAGGKVYWTNRQQGVIAFAGLDASLGGSLNTSPLVPSFPNAAAVYPGTGKLYWGNEGGDSIAVANLNNTGGGVFPTGTATTDGPIAPAVDPGSGKIYWGNAQPANKISYANLNGSGGADINTSGATVNNPHGVAIDPVAGRIYWANIGNPAGSASSISWANLNGTGGGSLNTTGATLNTPIGLAIDPSARRIYWGNEGSNMTQVRNRISYADLDGGGGSDLSTPGATLSGPRSPVLLKRPSGTRAPAIAGGTTPGSTLSCSAGSWAGDLLGSWLYQAPQRLSYSWTRNGAAIAGASAASYRATAAGSYRCIVTASNPAGSRSQTSAARVITAAPSFGTKTQVTVRPRARRIPARGPVKVVVNNKNSFAVSARLSMRVLTRRARGSLAVAVSNGNDFSAAGKLLAQASRRGLVVKSKSFTVGAQAKKRVKLKLSKPFRRLLKKKHKLSVRLTLKVTDPAGNKRTLSKKVVLRLKKT
jgi:DNA-binding beta-propeller fold protein YncE